MKTVTVTVFNNGMVVDKIVTKLTIEQIRTLETDKNYAVSE